MTAPRLAYALSFFLTATVPVVCWAQGDSGLSLLADGKWSLDARYRIETNDQDNTLESATASTLRTRVGFETDPEAVFGAMLQVEDVRALGGETYNSTTNGHTHFSAVPDPEATEINQAYIAMRRTGLRAQLGRQSFVLDDQRFFGDVGFRQNQQTVDALTLQATTPGGSRFIYAFLDQVNRFFGRDHTFGTLDLSTHALNYSLGRLNGDRLTAYGYLLEFDEAAFRASSTNTWGASYDGGIDVGPRKLLYSVEYARQSDYADNPRDVTAWYANAELGLRFVNQWVASAGTERLSGNGTYSFQTPLATLHKFNGFADVFAESTPVDGLDDRYVRLYMPVAGVRFTIAWHEFRSDNASRRYGNELDAEINWRVTPNWLVGAKYADYRADELAVDTRKAWLWVEAQF